MACNRNTRSGQAMTELIVAVLAMMIIILALTEFVPVFLENLALQKDVREEAGLAALRSEEGVVFADRRAEFELDVFGDGVGLDEITGAFSEKQYMPAASLACYERVSLPNINGAVEEIRYSNRDETSCFMSARMFGSVDQALAKARTAFIGSGWSDCGIGVWDAALFTRNSGRALAAVHVVEELSGDGAISVRLTVIARSAGGEIWN